MNAEHVINILAWPVVATVVLVFAISALRGSLKELLGRTKRIGAGNKTIEFDHAAAEQQAQENAAASKTITSAPATTLEDVSAAVRMFEQRISEDLSKYSESDDNRIKRLVRALALTQMQHQFEQIYRIIFNSQLELLMQANSGTVTQELARLIFQRAASDDPLTYGSVSFEKWVGFLEAMQLIAYLHDQHRYQATTKGVEFLHYLVASGLTAPKRNR